MRIQTKELLSTIVSLELNNIKPFDIAKRLSITPEYVYQLKNRYKEEYEHLKTIQAQEGENPKEHAAKIIESLTPTAARVLGEVLTSPKAGFRERRAAANDILDKAKVGAADDKTDEGLKGMKAILANIYKDCNITVENVDKSPNVHVDNSENSEVIDITNEIESGNG